MWITACVCEKLPLNSDARIITRDKSQVRAITNLTERRKTPLEVDCACCRGYLDLWEDDDIWQRRRTRRIFFQVSGEYLRFRGNFFHWGKHDVVQLKIPLSLTLLFIYRSFINYPLRHLISIRPQGNLLQEWIKSTLLLPDMTLNIDPSISRHFISRHLILQVSGNNYAGLALQFPMRMLTGRFRAEKSTLWKRSVTRPRVAWLSFRSSSGNALEEIEKTSRKRTALASFVFSLVQWKTKCRVEFRDVRPNQKRLIFFTKCTDLFPRR